MRDLKKDILRLLARPDYQPLEKVGLSRQLGLPAAHRRQVRDALAQLENEGRIARIRRNYFVLPATANLVTGTILAFPGGNAKLIKRYAKSLQRVDEDLTLKGLQLISEV